MEPTRGIGIGLAFIAAAKGYDLFNNTSIDVFGEKNLVEGIWSEFSIDRPGERNEGAVMKAEEICGKSKKVDHNSLRT